jgi:hypothetical protein
MSLVATIKRVTLQKKGIVAIGAGTAIFCGLVGAGYNTQVRTQDQSPAPVLASAATEPTAEPTEESVAEDPAEDRIPYAKDVDASIDEFQNLIDQANKVVRNLGNPASTEETSSWQKGFEIWDAKNNHLINRCELWLGADGTETYSSLSLSCENLKLGGKWLHKSMVAASLRHNAESKIYLTGANKAIKKARAVLRGKMNPARRTAIVKIPGNIRALEKNAGRL